MAKVAAIVSYLGSEGPLAAYRHYASVHSDLKAIWFKRLGTDKGGELEKWLPNWLGWSWEGIGESPLSTAIASGDLEMVQLVAKLNPKLFSQSMQTDSEYVTYTTPSIFRTSLSKLLQNQVPWSQSSLIGCGYIGKHQGYRLPPEKQGVTFAEGRYQRVNILCTINSLLIQFYEGGTSTIISSANKGDLLKFFLDKLTRDVNKCLLAQKSRYRRNTVRKLSFSQCILGLPTFVSSHCILP